MKILSFCKKYLLTFKFKIISYILFNIINTIIIILIPYLTSIFLDNITVESSINSVFIFCSLYLILSTIKIILGYIISMFYVKTQMLMSYEFIKDTLSHIQNLSISFINSVNITYLNQKVNSDCNDLIVFCTNVIQNFIINSFLILVSFTVLFNINFNISIILFIFIVIYVCLYIMFKNKLYKIGFELKENQNKFIANLYEQYELLNFVKMNSIQSEILSRLKSSFNTLRSISIKNQKINYLFLGLDNLILIISQITLFIFGGIQIINNNFTIGMFILFSTYFNIIIGSIRYFLNFGITYQNNLVSYDRLKNIYMLKNENNGNIKIDDIHKISITNLNFSYNNKKVISNFNACFKKGFIYCIEGKNGLGKSTLVKLIIGMYIDEKQGTIRYNDYDISEIDMISSRKNIISVNEQQPCVIDESLEYNLNFNRHNNYDEKEKNRIKEICKMLNIKSLDINNKELSEGEKQKISILRVLHKDSKMIIFDEPTSSLDVETKNKFINHIKKIKDNKIIIIITHEEFVKDICDYSFSLGI